MKRKILKAVRMLLVCVIVFTFMGCSSKNAKSQVETAGTTEEVTNETTENTESESSFTVISEKIADIKMKDIKKKEEELRKRYELIDSLSIDELAERVAIGEFGDGEELKSNLRDRYEEVQEYFRQKEAESALTEEQNNVVEENNNGNSSDSGQSAQQEEPQNEPVQPENKDYWSYSDGTCSIEIYKKWYADSWCYCAHVYVSDYTRFGSASANGHYGNGTETTYDAGQRLGAILCVNGDYADQAAEPHAAIRKGVVEAYGDKKTYVCEAYNSNTGMLFNAFEGYCFPGTDTRCSSYTISESAAAGLITDSFIFGPAGLNNGSFGGSNGGNKRPRTLIGTTGNPGDLWLVVTAGDYSDGVSPGLTGYEGHALLSELGCVFGGHLDGGGSSAMYFRGEMLVSNSGWAGRPVADFAFVK